MQSVVGRLAKAVPVAVGSAVAVSSGTHTAHADAAAPAASEVALRRLAGDWELCDVDAKDAKAVLFSPADIDTAVALLNRPPPSAVIEELDSDVSSDGSVDALIERSSTSSLYVGDSAAGGSMQAFGMDPSLFTVAARLLKAPGVQREICSAALSDPEVFEILAGKMDLPAYLEGQGFAARGLLGARGTATGRNTEEEEPAGGDSINPLERVSAWAADRVEDIGLAVVRLGRWMRQQIAGQASESNAGSEGGRFDRLVGGGTIAAVMVACVAIISVVLLKRPAHLRRLMQQMRAR